MLNARALLVSCVVLACATDMAAADPPGARPPADSIKIEHEYEDFDDDTEAWQLSSIDYSHKFQEFGTVILRVSQADRFGTEGVQYEVDMYPKIRKGTYAYLSVGVSGSSLFPERRYGAQIWQSLGNGYEGSLGVRYLAFDDAVTVWTGSIGKYKGNYYYVLSPYVVDGDDGTSATGILEIRRYFGDDPDDVFTFRVGYGNAPDVDTLLQVTTTLDHFSVGIGRDWKVGEHFVLGADIGYRDREYNVNVERQSVYVKGSFKYRF
ncbi:MAG: YaiO family outer membrane beta-barrel protein [Thermoanaerobaculia bacterium]|nr:YaiO family outer membrane beta-barrel protein [Thermoanaerobaculia bacterium]